MALKPRYKRRILWTVVSIVGITAVGVVVVPPMINLNALKPILQSAILYQTGVEATINGDVHFSLLGHATIVAHDVVTPMGRIRNVAFSVPLSDAFDLESANLTGTIQIHGGDLKIDSLVATPLNHDIDIYNTTFEFLDKAYTVVRGRLSDGELTGTVRTDQHKYDISFANNEFYVSNQNDNLEIYGQLYSDGTARGRMAIDTDDINRWFEFSEPKIDRRVQMTANFDWDGGYGFKFSDIYANDTVTGDIDLFPDGARGIKLSARDLDFDFSFLLQPTNLLQRTSYDLDLYGDLTLGKYHFNHLMIVANGTDEKLSITKIIADDISITGGTIDKNGAHNLTIQMPYQGQPATCMFSGTPDNWTCSQFTWGTAHGEIRVAGDMFNLVIQSPDQMPTKDTIARHASRLGTRGKITFRFSDMGGTIDIDTKSATPHYTFARDKTMTWLNPNFKFLPDFMTNDVGDFTWRGDTMDFVPHSGRWFLSLSGSRFYMTGTNIKDLFPNLDLQSVNNLEYTISGAYSKNNISDLKIEIAGHTFTGTFSDNALRLNTKLLNLDTFINRNFIDNYQELQFLTTAPIMIPFELKTNVFISADRIIYNGEEYRNFTYSLKPDVQAFSITDNARGNMLAIIEKDKSEYDISLQLNKFITHGAILSSQMPLNIVDTTVTADIEMTTSGHIAHDLEYNLSGNMELMFDGGYITGLGLDGFYASAENITTRMAAEYAMSDALDGGKTRLKSAYVVGEYKNGDFITTEPVVIQMRHSDAVGGIGITSSMMTATFDITMRGTAPTPVTVQLDVAPDNSRGYSLSEIMRNFDASFMRAFVKSHDKF